VSDPEVKRRVVEIRPLKPAYMGKCVGFIDAEAERKHQKDANRSEG
jgi:hypothetical protein